MNSQVYYTTEVGRIRADEARGRAAHYRLAQRAKRRAQRDTPLSPTSALVYRRALKIAALSVLAAGSVVVLF